MLCSDQSFLHNEIQVKLFKIILIKLENRPKTYDDKAKKIVKPEEDHIANCQEFEEANEVKEHERETVLNR